MSEWCDECGCEISGPLSEKVHAFAEEYAKDLVPSILDKPLEWRKHLLRALREGMCLKCGEMNDGRRCCCTNDE